MSEAIIKLHKLHPAQQSIVSEAKRFNVLKCGRQFGKTDLSLELAVIPLLDGHKVGYWYPTYKDGNKTWKEIKAVLGSIIESKDEQLKILTTITGGELNMWSMDDPDSGRGFKYHRVIVDEAEKAIHLKGAWEQTIRPTLLFFKGDAWFLSTPKFGDTYFKNTLFKNHEKDPENWKSWKFTSFDNPYLDPKEIEDARKLDLLVFRCEYLAEDVDVVNNPWAWAFNKEKHVAKVDIEPDPSQYLYLSFDFNVNPITCAVIQHIDETIYVIEQIKLANSDIYRLCDVILAKYPNYVYFITGDASGNNRSAMVKDNLTYYKIIQVQLSVNPNQFRLPNQNPKIEENQVLVNSILSNYPVRISPEKGKALIYDLQNVSVNADNSIKKRDRSDPTQQADAADCFVGETLIITETGEKRIDQIKTGEKVLTRNGYKKVIDSWDSFAEVWEFEFSDGTITRCTRDHKFLTTDGWFKIFDIFVNKQFVWKRLFTTEEVISSTRNKNTTIAETQGNIQDVCIDKCGMMFMGKFRKDFTYTIKTGIRQIIRLKILKQWMLKNICHIIVKNDLKITPNSIKSFGRKELKKRLNGIKVKRVITGTNNMPNNSHSENSTMVLINANTAMRNLIGKQSRQDSVQINVNRHGEEKINRIKKMFCVQFAERNLKHLNTYQTNIVQENVNLYPIHTEVRAKKATYLGKQLVYDITVENEHEFYANGILVHNCFRYYLNTFHSNYLTRK